MYKQKKIIAIIPARSGSKGMIDKNISLLDGKPLMAHSIISAIESNIFDEIYVSTDSELYSSIGEAYGASVPFLRPHSLSKDSSQAYEYIIHALENYRDKFNKEFDYFVVLQPTSPLRQPCHIIESIKLAIDNHLNSVVSVVKASHIPQLTNKLDDTLSMEGFYINSKNSSNRQDYGTYYTLNGAIYIMKTDKFMECRNYYIENSKAYIMEKIFSVDIDDELDFEYAQFIINKLKDHN